MPSLGIPASIPQLPRLRTLVKFLKKYERSYRWAPVLLRGHISARVPCRLKLRRIRVVGSWWASLLPNITRINIKIAWKIILVIKFVSRQSTLPHKLGCRLIVIRSGCVLAIFPPLHKFVCQWIVAARAIRSPIVKVVRQKLCQCS